MNKPGTIIVVDDNKSVLTAVELLLKNYFRKVVTLFSPVNLLSKIREEKAEAVLLDMNYTAGINNGNEGRFWLQEIRKRYPTLPVVLFTAYADIDLAVAGIKEGATDFIVKPWDNQKLVNTLLAAVSSKSAKAEKEAGQNAPPTSEMYWGNSEVMQNVRKLVERVAVTDANILITGENGTGKEMLAKEIHAKSFRKSHEMVTVDMGAIAESLFESELFGHVKGAFTDAHADRTGKFEEANQSTLFLDEIGNLPYHLQAKLLTVLQKRHVVRIGSNDSIPIDIRLICATNRDIEKMIGKGEFREDLFYRINTLHINLPPLREHKEDIVPLAQLFIARFCKQYNRELVALSEEACEKLTAHSWYGNIRELEHAIEKAVIICDSHIISAELFEFTQRTQTVNNDLSTLEEMEMKMVRQALEKSGGNLSAASVQLGITRQTLYNKMKKFGL